MGQNPLKIGVNPLGTPPAAGWSHDGSGNVTVTYAAWATYSNADITIDGSSVKKLTITGGGNLMGTAGLTLTAPNTEIVFTGDVTYNTSQTVTVKKLTINGTLTAATNVNIKGDLVVNGSLLINGNSIFDGALYVSGNATFNDDAEFLGAATILGTATFDNGGNNTITMIIGDNGSLNAKIIEVKRKFVLEDLCDILATPAGRKKNYHSRIQGLQCDE